MKLYKITELEISGEYIGYVLADSEEEALGMIKDSKWDFLKPEIQEVKEKGIVEVTKIGLPG